MTRSRYITGGVGVAVIGCGSIGSLRAQIAHRHPSVDYLAVCDIVEDKAATLAATCEADSWSTDPTEAVTREEVDAVIVASTEDSHFAPAMAALQAGKTLLVEKPFTLLPEEGQKLLVGAEEYGLRIYTGFTQRFRRRYLAIKEQINHGYIGDVTSAKATIYLASSVARAVISRARTTTPSVNTMTYLFDLLNWYVGDLPQTAYAAGSTKGRIYEEYGTVDSTWCVLSYADGMVANLGVSWELPEFWPAYVASMDFELFGREGTISVKDDHRDVLMASRKPIHSPYTPDTTSMQVAMLGSYMPGDWALGEHFGAMQEETHAFINSVGTGRPDPILATGQEGMDVLQISRAVDESTRTGQIVTLNWAR